VVDRPSCASTRKIDALRFKHPNAIYCLKQETRQHARTIYRLKQKMMSNLEASGKKSKNRLLWWNFFFFFLFEKTYAMKFVKLELKDATSTYSCFLTPTALV
jgi:hypothetical protein